MAERLTISAGHEAVARAYRGAFQGGATRFQGSTTEQETAKRSFKERVLSNPEITREDLIDFLAGEGVYKSIMKTYLDAIPSDDD